jgi:hypothetical protein
MGLTYSIVFIHCSGNHTYVYNLLLYMLFMKSRRAIVFELFPEAVATCSTANLAWAWIKHLAQECKHDSTARARTHNPGIKSQAPYPLGHHVITALLIQIIIFLQITPGLSQNYLDLGPTWDSNIFFMLGSGLV